MSASLDAALAVALTLSPEDRWELISRLAETTSSPPLYPAWEVEIARRIEELDPGQVQGVPFDEFMIGLKAKYELDRPGD